MMKGRARHRWHLPPTLAYAFTCGAAIAATRPTWWAERESNPRLWVYSPACCHSTISPWRARRELNPQTPGRAQPGAPCHLSHAPLPSASRRLPTITRLVVTIDQLKLRQEYTRRHHRPLPVRKRHHHCISRVGDLLVLSRPRVHHVHQLERTRFFRLYHHQPLPVACHVWNSISDC